jgi:hypothetical protein
LAPTKADLADGGRSLRRGARIFIDLLLALLVFLATAWAALALWYRLPAQNSIGLLAAVLFGLLGLATVFAQFRRSRWRVLTLFAAALACVAVWWSTIEPVDADWAPEVGRQVTGALDGDSLKLTDVRNFVWRSNSDFDAQWSARSYDLTKLRSVDLVMSHWAGAAIAHMIITFGFEGDSYLAWSVEVRRSKQGEFSTIADFFKNDPLVIIAADERDIIRLRTNIRREDVTLYRMRASQTMMRALLLEYVNEANRLAATPVFYNTLTTSCTTDVVKMLRVAGDPLPFDWRLILNGYVPSFAYDRGVLARRLPFAELEARAHIDERARQADLSPEFSLLIRAGLPDPNDAGALK